MESSRPRRQEDLGVVDGLVQTSALVQAVFARSAASMDLSVLQARLLGVLRDREPTMAEVRRLLDLDKSSTTGLIDRVERRELVRREQVPEDGRSYRVVLTPEGLRVARMFVATVTAELDALTEDLSDTNRHRLSLLLSGVVHRHAARHGIDLSAGMEGAQPGRPLD